MKTNFNKVFSLVLIIIISATIIVSCEKTDVAKTTIENKDVQSLKNGRNSNEIVLKSRRVTDKSIKKIVSELDSKGVYKKYKNSSLQQYQNESSKLVKSNFTASPELTTLDEQEIKAVISPLVQNGQQIYNEILSNVINTPEWEQLSDEDKNSILNINNDEQFTDLALMFSIPDYNMQVQNLTTRNQPISNKVDLGEIVHDCIGVALGIRGIKELLTGVLTVEKGISLLKIMGKRYLSYVGIAWLIWDFTSCVNNFL